MALVATREGGVDRNVTKVEASGIDDPSPPARVAWIETQVRVAQKGGRESPPARVAWIETVVAIVAYIQEVRRHPRGWRG